MFFVHEATLSPKEIENKIENDAKQFQLIMKKHFPFSVNLPEAGVAINAYASVFELCNISLAGDVLNQHPELSILMPCRISVYEKESKTFVSTANLETHLKDSNYEEPLQQEMLGLYRNIKAMIQNW